MKSIFTDGSLLHATSNTQDGNMSFVLGDRREAENNRRLFLQKLDLSSDDVTAMEVEHGEQIAVLSEHQSRVTAEACITNEKNIFLFLLTADCLPIAFFDPTEQVVALAHVGWKPTSAHLVAKVILKMQEVFNTKPEDVLVSIGPGIHRESYKVLNPSQKASLEWKPFLIDVSSGETEVNLIGFNVLQLKEVGVLEQNISISGIDTALSKEYFSHYRSVRTGEPEGRFATLLGFR